MAAKRGGYKRGADTRASIVLAAREVVRENGVHGMTIGRVAEKSGMTRAGVTYHFPSSEHLLLGVMERQFRENSEWFDGRLAEPGCDVLDVMIDVLGRLVDEPEMATVLMVVAGASIDPEHPAHDWYAGRYEFMRPGLASNIEAGQGDGVIRKDVDATATAIQLIALLEGLLLQWLNNRDAVKVVDVMTASCELLRAERTIP